MSVSKWLDELNSGNDSRAEYAALHPPENQLETLDQLNIRVNDPDPDQRWWACRALSSFDHSKASEILLICLIMEDLQMKICAAKGLQLSPSVEALEALCNLLGHANALLRRLAGDALISLENQASASLISVLQKRGEKEKIEAARALSFIQDPISIRALFEQLEDATSNLEFWINKALDNMGIGMQFFSPTV